MSRRRTEKRVGGRGDVGCMAGAGLLVDGEGGAVGLMGERRSNGAGWNWKD